MLKTLLYLSLCGTALGCVVAIMQRLVGRRLPSRFYYFAYLVVLARFALPIPGLVATERAAESERVTASQPSHLAALPSARDSRSDVVMPMEPSDAADEPMAVGCGLFGCGIRGVRAEACTDLAVRNTEIYDCSLDAARITSCENVVFENCDIHDCNSNEIVVFESTNVTQDGKDLTA